MDYFNPATGGFLRSELHAIPEGAVRISARRKRELLEAQGNGRPILVKDGKPVSAPKMAVTVAMKRAAAVSAVKGEAAQRILAIASLERQANDNAALALAALSGDVGLEAQQARDRRVAIDAIRAASNKLEAAIASWSTAALSNLDVAASPLWPKEA